MSAGKPFRSAFFNQFWANLGRKWCWFQVNDSRKNIPISETTKVRGYGNPSSNLATKSPPFLKIIVLCFPLKLVPSQPPTFDHRRVPACFLGHPAGFAKSLQGQGDLLADGGSKSCEMLGSPAKKAVLYLKIFNITLITKCWKLLNLQFKTGKCLTSFRMWCFNTGARAPLA